MIEKVIDHAADLPWPWSLVAYAAMLLMLTVIVLDLVLFLIWLTDYRGGK